MQTLQIEIKNPPKFNNSLMQNPQIEAIPEIQNALIRNIPKPKPFKSKTPKLKTPEVQKLPNANPQIIAIFKIQNPKSQTHPKYFLPTCLLFGSHLSLVIWNVLR